MKTLASRHANVYIDPQMSTTLSEVASRSGVAMATVSRILNRGAHLYKPTTRARVLKAASELGYQPNRVARSLVTGQTNMVAVHVVWLHTQFYARICDALQREISGHGYQMMFQKLRESVPLEGEAVPRPTWPVDGEIVVDGGPRFLDERPSAFPTSRPMVSIGVYCVEQVDHVKIDVYHAAMDAFEHLRATGRKRLAYVVDSPTKGCTAEPMIRAYFDFTAKWDLNPDFIIAPQRIPPSIEEAVRARFGTSSQQGRPDALFCHGDIVAHVALRVLNELKISVPTDVAIVGCGGGEETAYQSPSLTTIGFPVAEMTRLAWQFLERRIESPDAPLQQSVLRAQLIVRESTAGSSSSTDRS